MWFEVQTMTEVISGVSKLSSNDLLTIALVCQRRPMQFIYRTTVTVDAEMALMPRACRILTSARGRGVLLM